MKFLLLYPLNIAFVLLISLFFSLFNFSDFFKQVNVLSIFFVLLICSFYIFQYFFIKKYEYYKIDESDSNAKGYKPYLIFGVVGFFVEFIIYGVPLFSIGGRDGVGVIPVLHVVFYSSLFMSILFSSLYSKKIDIFICLFFIFVVSFIGLSRQLMMVSFLIYLISYIFRNKISKKSLLKISILILLLILAFGLIGNYRQKLSGDYVDQYIILIGGANENGQKLGDILYWFWLYIASPMYNLFVNFDSYYHYGSKCNTSVYYGSCAGDFFSSVLLPDTLVKYLSVDKFLIDLQVEHLNVGTGFSASARIFGIWGVFLQICFQWILYSLGMRVIGIRYRGLFIVYFSVLSIFMIFDNLFIRAEFFLVFIFIFFAKFKFSIK